MIVTHRNIIITIMIIGAIISGCRNAGQATSTAATNSQTISPADSIALTTLVRHVYELHCKSPKVDFPLLYRTPGDSIFTGIDFNVYGKNMDTLRKTNFFAPEFFARHRSIALNMDSSIRLADINDRNSNDGVTMWDTDADEWCQCQDNPDDYWEMITLSDFSYNQDTVSFYWSWGTGGGMQANQYKMKARKENQFWKISYMAGFLDYLAGAESRKSHVTQ